MGVCVGVCGVGVCAHLIKQEENTCKKFRPIGSFEGKSPACS